MRPVGGGGGRSLLPQALAATALTAAAAGTTAYVCRARLASVVASRVVGARIVVGGVDIDVDLLGRRRRRRRLDHLRRRADAGDAAAGGAAEEGRRNSGPAVGVRDVVLYDDNDRVALRLPAVRVQLSKEDDEAGTAVEAAVAVRGGRVMDVDVVRPHAFLIFDNLILTRSNWATLAVAAANRFGGGGEAAPPPPPPPSSPTPAAARRGHRGAPPRAVPTNAPAPGGVRLRRVRLADGADLSVTSSVLNANGGSLGLSSGRPLLPSTVHVSELAISPADVTSLAALEAVVSALAARAFATTGARRGLPSGVGAAVKSYVRAAAVQGTAGARAAARGHLRRVREDMEEVDQRVLRHFGPSLQTFRVRCLGGFRVGCLQAVELLGLGESVGRVGREEGPWGEGARVVLERFGVGVGVDGLQRLRFAAVRHAIWGGSSPYMVGEGEEHALGMGVCD